MSVTIGELLVNLRASTAAFAKDLGKASQLSFNTAREMERSFKRLGGVITAELTAAAGAVGLAVAHALENADHMGILAHQAGLTADQFTALSYAASLSGISAETLSGALVRLSVNLEKSNQQTNEGKAAHSALSTLFRGNIPVFKDTNEAFLTIIERLHNLGPGYQQTALASQIFGRGIGAQLVPMLETREGMRKLADEARSLGQVIGDDVANRANQFNDTIIKLEDSVKGLALKVAIELLPYLEKLANQLVELGKGANSSNTVVHGLATVVKGLATVVIAVAGGLNVLGAQLAQFVSILAITGDRTLSWKDKMEGLKQAEKNVQDAFLSTVETIQNLWAPAMNAGAAATTDVRQKTVLLANENDKLKKSYEEIVKKLSEEITTLTLGSAAVEVFKLKAEGASDTQLKFVSSLESMVKNLKAGKDAFTGLIPPGMIEQSNAFGDSVTRIDTTYADLKEKGFAAWERARTPLERYSHDVSNLAVLLDAGVISQETFNRLTLEWATNMKLVAVQVDRMLPVLRAVGEAIAETFIAGVFHASSFIDALGRILEKLAEVIFQALVLKPLFNWLSGGGGVWSKIFGGFFASGGSVSAGSAYVVGEKGPELFMPGVSGTIVPNASIGKGGNTFIIDARGTDPVEVERRVRRAIAESESRAVQKSVLANRDQDLRTA